MTYKDKTFCASPNCKNACGRKMNIQEEFEVKLNNYLVWYGYFCEDDTSKYAPSQDV